MSVFFFLGTGEWDALLHPPEGWIRGGERPKTTTTTTTTTTSSSTQRGEEDSEEASTCLSLQQVPWL